MDEALDIARKSHADAVLLGSFLTLGEKTLINTRLFETASGQLIAADQFRWISRRIFWHRSICCRRNWRLIWALRRPIAHHQTSLAEAMTDNLEAYRYYSLGVSKAQAFQNAQAMALLHKAVQLDPKFAMAYARIGYAYSVTDFVPEKGRPYLAKAIQLSDRLIAQGSPVRDGLVRHRAAGLHQRDSHHATNRRPIPAGNGSLHALGAAALRRGAPARDDRGGASGTGGRSGFRRSVQRAGNLLLGLRKGTMKPSPRINAMCSLRRPNPIRTTAWACPSSSPGNYERAAAEYNAALSLDPEFEPAIIHLGDVYFQQGRYRDAIRQYRRYIQVTGSDAARAVGSAAWRRCTCGSGISAARNRLPERDTLCQGRRLEKLLLDLERGARAAD